jgi:Spy/CpxP family protein refolding chaperone
MKSPIKIIAVAACLVSAAGSAVAAAEAAPTPYAGQQARAIKSLSDQEVAGLLAGKGAGFAKAAELNGYPGPAHVLELAEPLQLSTQQTEATRALMAAHQGRARQLGSELLVAERELDALFANKRANAASVDRATQRVGALQASVRAEHLTTHLTQTALLNPEQVRRYSVLRGYTGDAVNAPPAAEKVQPAHSGHRH